MNPGDNLSDEQKSELQQRCLFCRQDLFWVGPQALGLSFNVYCAVCCAGYNITHYQLPWQLIALPGERTPEELAPIVRGPKRMPELSVELSKVIEEGLRHAFARARSLGPQAPAGDHQNDHE